MADLSDFANRCKSDLPGCPGPIIRDAVRDTVIDFCRETGRLRKSFEHAVAVVDVDTADNDSVTISLSSYYTGHTPVRLAEFAVDGYYYTTVWFEPSTDLTDLSSLINTSLRYYHFPSSTQIKLFPFTGTVAAMNFFLRLTVQPDRDATSVDDLFWNDYLDAIVAGTKQRLMAQVGKTWSNPEASGYFGRKYIQGRDSAKIDVMRMHSHADQLVEANFF